MRCICWLLPVLLLPWVICGSGVNVQAGKTADTFRISWKKIVIDKTFRSEGVAVADVNKDGRPDVLVGDCWYEAPQQPGGEWKRHIIRADRAFNPGSYSEAFGCFADDFNGDGYADLLVIPFPGKACYWYENPGAGAGKWKQHLVTNSSCNETPIFVDLFKTGKNVLVMGWNPEGSDNKGEMCYFLPGKDPTQPWQRVSVSGPAEKGKTIPATGRFSHGLGHGDINGDGRQDILCPQGWWEQPEKPDGKPWLFHPANITDSCANMYALDIDGDGKTDILSSSAHGYGLWWSQQKDASSFVQRALFPTPAEVANLTAAPQVTKEEKTLLDTINKLRNDRFKRASFVAHPELCRMARDHAERLTRMDAKEVNIAGKYPGKVLVVNSKKFAMPGEKKDEKPQKGQLSPLQLFALSLLPDNIKDRDLVMPGFEIGVGAAKNEDGEIQYTLIIGDREQFSLPSQTHALNFVDIDGDGLKDMVTGRRWWAHGPDGDAGPGDPAFLYWFQAKRNKEGFTSFIPHKIDDDSGIGTQFAIADINGDGLLDIIISNKKGVFVFLQIRTPAVESAPPPRRE